MRVGTVVLCSAGLHGLVLAAIDRWISRTEQLAVPTAPAAAAPASTPPTPPTPSTPIEISILDLRDEPPALPPAREPAHATAAYGAARITAADTRATASTSPMTKLTGEPAESPGRGPGADMFHHMRGAELRPAEGVMERIADAGGEQPHDPLRRSGRIENAPNGTAIVHDEVAIMHVERDGTAHLERKPDITFEYRLPLHPNILRDLRDAGRAVADWYVDPGAGARFGRKEDLPEHLRAVEGGCDSWGDVLCDDANAPGIEKHARETASGGNGAPVIGGKLDITSYLARKLGVGDVYASRKLKLLDDTRDERAARGADFRADQLARSAELVRKSLQRLWAATSDPVERRTVMFELWDDCAEGDGPLGEAGLRARAQVIGWIRGHLPQGSSGAYSHDELQRLNDRRASQQRFEPY